MVFNIPEKNDRLPPRSSAKLGAPDLLGSGQAAPEPIGGRAGGTWEACLVPCPPAGQLSGEEGVALKKHVDQGRRGQLTRG